ncbi:acyl-CoA N-acyltransferase [Ochromonadaceae sp. CCMP2298]|nr:acyl-CoA N-acyltransferase [Ochromonadaceae sp. CCMP2298]
MWAPQSLLLLLGSHLVLPRTALKTAPFIIKPAALDSLHQTAYLMAQERLNMREGVDLVWSLFTSPAFSIVFSQELERLQDNFRALGNDHRLLVAETDDFVLGYIDVDNRPQMRGKLKDGEGPYVSDLVCTSSWRRRGIASALLLAAEDICRLEWTETCTHLLVDTINQPAIRLYERAGYAPVRVEREVEVEEVEELKEEEGVKQQGQAGPEGNKGEEKKGWGYQAAQAMDRRWVVEKEDRVQTQTLSYADLCAAVYSHNHTACPIPLEDEAFLLAFKAYPILVMKKLL